MSNAEFSTGGYAPGFVEDWYDERVSNKQIAKQSPHGYRLTEEYRLQLMSAIKKYE